MIYFFGAEVKGIYCRAKIFVLSSVSKFAFPMDGIRMVGGHC